MLTITKRLRRHAIKHFGASADATDKELTKLFGQKLLKNALSVDDIEAINAGTFGEAAGNGRDGGAKGKGGNHTRTRPAAAKKGNKSAPEPAADDDDDRQAAARRLVRRELRAAGVIGKPGDVSPEQAFTKSTRIRVKE